MRGNGESDDRISSEGFGGNKLGKVRKKRGKRERERLEEKQIHSGVSLNYKPTLSTAHTANHLKATQECVQIPPHW